MTQTNATHIYLLWHATDGVFKLGRANDVHARIRCLSDPIDLERSRHIRVPNATLANRLEKLCHALFGEFARPREHRADGYTEWFDQEAFDRVVAFLESNRVVMGCGPVCPLPAKVRAPSFTGDEDPQRVARREERERRELAKAKRDEKQREEFNAQALRTAIEWLRAVRERATIVGWHGTTFVIWVHEEWDQFRDLGQLHQFFTKSLVFSMFEACSCTSNGLVIYRCGGEKEWFRGRCARWGLPELEPLERLLLAAPAIPAACVDDLESLSAASFYELLDASEEEQKEWSLFTRKVTSRIIAEVMEDRKPVPEFKQYCFELA